MTRNNDDPAPVEWGCADCGVNLFAGYKCEKCRDDDIRDALDDWKYGYGGDCS